jgi:conjugal transfer mating pair stabilization protein TraN
MILIHLIWTCTQNEFQLGVQRELKACHRVGFYCRKKLLGACIESRDSDCCFNTPLSRILNEQIRGQFDRDDGSAKDPDCSGIGIADLGRVDLASHRSERMAGDAAGRTHHPHATRPVDLRGTDRGAG